MYRVLVGILLRMYLVLYSGDCENFISLLMDSLTRNNSVSKSHMSFKSPCSNNILYKNTMHKHNLYKLACRGKTCGDVIIIIKLS